MAMLNNQMVVISSLRLALWLRILHTYGSEFSTRVPHLVSAGNWANFAIRVAGCSSLGFLVDRHKNRSSSSGYIWCFQPIPKHTSTSIWYHHPISRVQNQTSLKPPTSYSWYPQWSSPCWNSRPNNQDAESGTKPLLKLCLSAPSRRIRCWALRWAVGLVLGLVLVYMTDKNMEYNNIYYNQLLTTSLIPRPIEVERRSAKFRKSWYGLGQMHKAYDTSIWRYHDQDVLEAPSNNCLQGAASCWHHANSLCS
jgi:hypothetical protein